MAKQKRAMDGSEIHDEVAAVMEQLPTPNVEHAREMMQQATEAVRNGEASDRPARRKARRNATERTYFVVGRPHDAAPLSFIMEAPTVGQARKRLDMVKTMPAYAGYRLRCVRVTYVP